MHMGDLSGKVWLVTLPACCLYIFDGGLHQPRTCEPFYKTINPFGSSLFFLPFLPCSIAA